MFKWNRKLAPARCVCVSVGWRFFQCVRRDDGEGEWRMHSLASSHSMLFLSFSLFCVLRSIYFLNARRRTIWTEKREKKGYYSIVADLVEVDRPLSCVQWNRCSIVPCPTFRSSNDRSERERTFLFNWLNRKWVKAILQVIVYAYEGMHCNVKCSLPLAIWTDFLLLLLLWARDGQG